MYTIRNIPTLKTLDFIKITKTERERADRLANSAAGAALESDVQGEGRLSNAKTKTFVPGEGRSAEESFVTNFTPEQKEVIRQMVAHAKSPEEIEAIESSVRRGIFPTAIANGDASRKRPLPTEDNGNGETKKSRIEDQQIEAQPDGE